MARTNKKTAQIKIKDLTELADILNTIKKSGKKIVHCHGVFDLLHIGHIRHFRHAKALGDILVATLTPDRHVNKGPQRPAFTEELRAEAIAALDCVDYVSINKWPAAVETIQLLKPDIYAKGSDYENPQNDLTGKIIDEKHAVESIGGMIIYTEDITYSSSSLINKYLPVFSKEVSEYLEEFSTRHSSSEIIDCLKNLRPIKALVVGETIIDEYHYCSQIGKSNKEPILATQYVSTEKFAGGILAAANHVSNFCDDVTVISMLGAQSPQEEFIRDHLAPNVQPHFIHKANSPTIVKRRYIESYLLQKLFEVYEMNDEDPNEEQEQELCNKLKEYIPQHDIVIVVDYGHGMLTRNSINVLCQDSCFLAVNTQGNAGNRGINPISRYSQADYICLAQPELELEERRRGGNNREMVTNVSQKTGCNRIIITRGKNGSICYSSHEGFIDVPAFTEHVVDRIGAGDAVLSLTALCLAKQAPMEVVGFIGNAVGAQAVGIMGNRSSIDPTYLYKHIESLLK